MSLVSGTYIMNGDPKYHLKEAYRELELALIGCRKKTREHIEKAIETLKKYEKEKKCIDT